MSAMMHHLELGDLTHLEASQLRRRLAELIHQYVRERSVALAETILCYIEALCLHPDDCREAEQLCAYRRLARHWRCLADVQRLREQQGDQGWQS
ncbi:hypothetical protein [Allochromatium vinosum]|uniref:ATP dependent RNA helicase n=1 Tax=Allochromatium vinosum (strain ATCC 17899 / DSM 180 / NBRC 103801 / NCIMB 10441 / D) TaxID=572477 RepID=D3RTW0_ALLVD|nr:hypothetical protein [Allochromatium vinosum]ADC62619.1 ATP dependent RNA helicase [Allochromatium vinosum DSM 180]MBK1653375.1 ATP dependent RNA helicase [Allochromatium vinosum]